MASKYNDNEVQRMYYMSTKIGTINCIICSEAFSGVPTKNPCLI